MPLKHATPHLGVRARAHIGAARVYPPSEDSYLLLDGLCERAEALRDLGAVACVEVGPGAGLAIALLGAILGPTAAYFAVDSNPHACEATQETAQINRVAVDVIRGDLLTAFRAPRPFDVVLFNPPYLQGGHLGASWIATAIHSGLPACLARLTSQLGWPTTLIAVVSSEGRLPSGDDDGSASYTRPIRVLRTPFETLALVQTSYARPTPSIPIANEGRQHRGHEADIGATALD